MRVTDSFFIKWRKEYALFLSLLLPIAGCKEQKHKQVVPVAQYVVMHSQDVELLVELTGRVSSMRISDVRPQVNGYLYKRLFEEGTDVVQGQQLYQVDPRPYQASLEQAEGKLAHDQATLRTQTLKLKRYGPLQSMDAVSRQDYDDTLAAQLATKADVEADKAAVKQAKLNLEYTEIRAPISGRISRSVQTQGSLMSVNQADPIAVITQLDPIFIDIIEPTAERLRLRSRLKEGQLPSLRGAVHVPVDLTLEDGSKYPIQANLLFTEVVADQQTGSVIQRAVVRNPDKLLLAGMYIRATLHEGHEKNAFLVPQEAVMRDQANKPYVYTINDKNTLERRPITLQRMEKTFWVVTEGMKEGDRVLVSNPTSYQTSQKVNPVEGRTPTSFVPD